ncbi:MAG: Crp/Fnr family transcriptional regulator [Bacteroidota bacterium]
MTPSPVNPIGYIEALAPLSPDERAWLAEQFARVELAKGEHLLREGDRCTEIAFILEGVLRVYLLDDGDEQTAYFGTDGQFVTDYESVLTGAPSAMNIDAITDCRLSVLSHESLMETYARVEAGERIGRFIAERLFLAAHQRLTSFYLDSAEERYLKLMAAHPNLIQQVPQHRIASYLGVRPQSLSRIRARMAGRGSSPG